MEIDFIVGNGREIGRVVGPGGTGGPVTRHPPVAHDGPIGFVESAMRWAWHEFSKRV
jgi:hypothetical protein